MQKVFKCPTHDFAYVAMPRGGWTEDSSQYLAKCPLAACLHGVTFEQLDNVLHERQEALARWDADRN